MKDETENYYIILALIIGSAVALLSIYLHYVIGLHILIVTIVVLLYGFLVIAISLRTTFMLMISRTAKKLRFRVITGFFDQPKLMGHYKHQLFQLHYREKETGHFRGVFRTYVKLIFKQPKRFNEKALEKATEQIGGIRIFRLKHIEKEDKNYLLMKAAGFVFNREKLHMLMDELIKISDKTEIKK